MEHTIERFTGANRDFLARRAEQYGAYTFRGTSDPADAEVWLGKVERAFQRMECPPDRQVRVAEDLMEDSAYFWWDHVSRRRVDTGPMTWAEFRVLFLERYFSSAIQDQKYREFQDLQQGDISVQEYLDLFLSLSRYAPSLIATEVDRCRWFEQGLRQEIQDKFASTMFTDFMELVNSALKAERNLLSGRTRQLDAGGPSQGPSKRLSTSGSESSGGSRPSSPYSDLQVSINEQHKERRQGFRQRFKNFVSGVMGSSSRRKSRSGTTGASHGGASRNPSPIPRDYPYCATCGKYHLGQCQKGSTTCFLCGQEGHYLRQCPQGLQRSASVSDQASRRSFGGASSSGIRASMVGRGTTPQGRQIGRSAIQTRLNAMTYYEDRAFPEGFMGG